MKKIINFVRKTLHVSPAEARGVVLIFFGMLVLISVPFISDYFFSLKKSSIQIYSAKQLDSLTIQLDEKSSNYQANEYPSFNKDYSKDEKSLVPRAYFSFNPNTASTEQLQSLGIPKFLANRIEHYRQKGGKFKKKEDLAKIYDFPEDLYQKLLPYIALPSAENESINTPQAERISSNSPDISTKNNSPQSYSAAMEFNTPKTTFTAKNPQKFDMNTADTTAFKNVKGIGSAYAKRIVNFRDKLGGFAQATQVSETFGLPPETVEELLKYGFVKAEVKKIKINEINAEELRHPYLKYFQAKAIIAYRMQHGKFNSLDDMKKIKVLDEATLEKIKPYLEF